jgi:NAD(P)-dependent dehydrogenase (short-subunit alcohol dehydrogenase family)
MAAEFLDRVALVTGASSGIGRATALAFAREGARVAVADVQVEAGQETVALIERQGGKAIFVRCDVSRNDDVKALVEKVVQTWDRLDFAHNNAGIEGTQALTADCTEDAWDRIIAINLKGVWLCMRHEIPLMLRRGGGSIVNTASVAGLVGFAGLPAYCASKGGIIQLTRTAALEYAKAGIRVNVVCPGVVRTPMVDRLLATDPKTEAAFVAMEPIGRFGKPEEIADAVLWLCSGRASFVTGHALVVDGGLVAA